MFDGVGRRRDESTGQLVSIGEHSLNGYERDCLFRNNGDGTFTDVAYVANTDRVEDGRGLSVFDYNLDGTLDVALRNYQQPAQLLRNASDPGHWLELKLIGTDSNRDAVGARITVESGGVHQTREIRSGSGYLSGSSLIAHFGLGANDRIESILVRWPSGRESTLTEVTVNQRLMLREGAEDAVPVRRWIYAEPELTAAE